MNKQWMIEASVLYLPVCIAWALWLLFRPRIKVYGALTLSLLWNFTVLFIVNKAAIGLGWWEFSYSELNVAGVPLVPLIGWSILWGICFPLLPTQNGLILVLLATLIDIVAMPLLDPIVILHGSWWWGEAIALMFSFIPGILIYRWTVMKRSLENRIIAQGIIYAFLVLYLIPQIIFQLAEGTTLTIPPKSWILFSLQIQLMLGFASVGILAVIEFAKKGNGTPVPFDPPFKLVRSGPYAYLINPMQWATTGFMLCYGWFLESWLLAASSPMVILYSIGIATPSEKIDLSKRFKDEWTNYRRHFINFLPRFRPVETNDKAAIYFAETCDTCNQIGNWFKNKKPVGLRIEVAENYPGGLPERATYLACGGTYSGIKAIGKALEHIHIGWAIIGWFMQIPIICTFLQVIVDLEGIGPSRETPKPSKQFGKIKF